VIGLVVWESSSSAVEIWGSGDDWLSFSMLVVFFELFMGPLTI